MLFDRIYQGMTRGELIWSIHFETDTSAGLSSLTDSELIARYQSVCEVPQEVAHV